MTPKVALPSDDQVQQAVTTIIDQARDQGRRPTVTALAATLGMHHSTFWRHFPDVARQMVDHARATPARPGHEPGRHDKLLEDQARLKRHNAQLRHDLEQAKAVIQRLAMENAALRASASSNVAPFHQRAHRSGN